MYDEDPADISPAVGETAGYLGFPLSGRAIIAPRPVRQNCYAVQCLETAADFSLPLAAVSDLPSSPFHTPLRLPRLTPGLRDDVPASSIYPSSPPTTHFAREAQHNHGSSPASVEKNLFQPRAAKEHNGPFLGEKAHDQIDIGVQATARATPTRHLNLFFGPRPKEAPAAPNDEVISPERREEAEETCSRDEETSNNDPDDEMPVQASSTGTVLIRRRPENTLFSALPELVAADGSLQYTDRSGFIAASEQPAGMDSTSASESFFVSPAGNTRIASARGREQAALVEDGSPSVDDLPYPFTHRVYSAAIENVPTMGALLQSRSYSNASPDAKRRAVTRVQRIATLVGTIKQDFETICNPMASNDEESISQFEELVSELRDLKEDWYQDDEDLLEIENRVAGYDVEQGHFERENATKDALMCLQTRLASATTKLAKVESCGHENETVKLHTQLQAALDRMAHLNNLVYLQSKSSGQAAGTIEDLHTDVSELEAELRVTRAKVLQERENTFVQKKLHDGDKIAFAMRREKLADALERLAETSKEVTVLRAKEEASKVVFDRMMAEKSLEIASKDQELESLRKILAGNPLAVEVTQLHESMHDSRWGMLKAMGQAEATMKALEGADDKQALAEHEVHQAKIAQTFTQISLEEAEEYRDNLKELVTQLQAQRDQALKERDDALAEVHQWQNLCERNFLEDSRESLEDTRLIILQIQRERIDHVHDRCAQWENIVKGLMEEVKFLQTELSDQRYTNYLHERRIYDDTALCNWHEHETWQKMIKENIELKERFAEYLEGEIGWLDPNDYILLVNHTDLRAEWHVPQAMALNKVFRYRSEEHPATDAEKVLAVHGFGPAGPPAPSTPMAPPNGYEQRQQYRHEQAAAQAATNEETVAVANGCSNEDWEDCTDSLSSSLF